MVVYGGQELKGGGGRGPSLGKSRKQEEELDGGF